MSLRPTKEQEELGDTIFELKNKVITKEEVNEILTHFLDSIREYIVESSNDLSDDERESKEFVDIYLEYAEDYPEEYPATLVKLIKNEKKPSLDIEKQPTFGRNRPN